MDTSSPKHPVSSIRETKAVSGGCGVPFIVLISAIAVVITASAISIGFLLSRDTTAPIVLQVTPADGTILSANNTHIVIMSIYSDDRGIDVKSVRLVIDGRDVTPQAFVSDTSISYGIDLEPGQHVALVQVDDTSGNRVSRTWRFKLDAPPEATATPISASTIVPTPTRTPSRTPTPTATKVPIPPPSITFSASQTVINRGDSVLLTWSAQNADISYLNQEKVNSIGSRLVTVDNTTVYHFIASNAGGTTEKAITITVPAISDLVVSDLSVNSSNQIVYTIRNIGASDVTRPFLIQVYVNGQLVDSNRPILTLSVDAESKAVVSNYLVVGTALVEVRINPNQEVQESNYNNNNFIRTLGPAPMPTFTSTNTPTRTPTSTLTNTPTRTPTSTPTNTPTPTPTFTPTQTPSFTPTNSPTKTSTPTSTSTNTSTRTPTVPPVDPPTNTATPTATVCGSSSSIQSSFNTTPIAGGSYIWFNSVIEIGGMASKPTIIDFDNSMIQFMTNNISYTLNVPGASVSFSPTISTTTNSFDAANNRWLTIVPLTHTGKVFLAGLAFPMSVGGLPGDISPVMWSGRFTTTLPTEMITGTLAITPTSTLTTTVRVTPTSVPTTTVRLTPTSVPTATPTSTTGITFTWQWAAAVYTQFSMDYTALGVKPTDNTSGSQSMNLDSAGTPENFKLFVIGGARGDGSTYTGSFTAPVLPSPCSVVASESKRLATSRAISKPTLLENVIDLMAQAIGRSAH